MTQCYHFVAENGLVLDLDLFRHGEGVGRPRAMCTDSASTSKNLCQAKKQSSVISLKLHNLCST